MTPDILLLLMNILLLGLATVTAVAAIGGETRSKEESNFFKSLTGHGWTALICAVLALAAGIGKEILTRQESATQEKENAELRGQSKRQLAEIAALRSDLKDANATIIETRSKLLEEQKAPQKTTDAIQAYAYERLSLYTSRYVTSLGRMIAAASDGWLPSNKQELFSPRSVNLVCRWLNAQAAAPAYPAMSWWVYFRNQSHEYEDRLINLLNSFATRLPPELIDSIAGVARSWLLVLPRIYSGVLPEGFPKGMKPSPMICLSLFDSRFEKAFSQLFGLVNHIAKAEKNFRLESRMTDKLLLGGVRSITVGSSRLSESEAKKFLDSQK
jgi:hypothetical protein